MRRVGMEVSSGAARRAPRGSSTAAAAGSRPRAGSSQARADLPARVRGSAVRALPGSRKLPRPHPDRDRARTLPDAGPGRRGGPRHRRSLLRLAIDLEMWRGLERGDQELCVGRDLQSGCPIMSSRGDSRDVLDGCPELYGPGSPMYQNPPAPPIDPDNLARYKPHESGQPQPPSGRPGRGQPQPDLPARVRVRGGPNGWPAPGRRELRQLPAPDLSPDDDPDEPELAR